jgi:hypothetical protein
MRSKTKSVYKYNIMTCAKPMGIYYFMVLMIITFFVVIALFSSGSTHVSGVEFATVIFLLVMALADFRENFEALNQYGMSRKTIYKGKVLAYSSLALAAAIIDRIIVIAASKITSSLENFIFGSFFTTMYESFFDKLNFWSENLLALLLSFSAYLALMSFGTFLSAVFYRSNRIGRIAIAAGVPIFIFVALPIIAAYVFTTNLANLITKFIDFTLSTPLRTSATCLLGAIILGVISYPIIVRATLKGK